MGQELLIEPGDARDHIQKKGSDLDDIIYDACEAVSGMIREETDRLFSTPAQEESREFAVRGSIDRVYIDEVFGPSQVESVTTPVGDPVSYAAVSTDRAVKKGIWLYFGRPANLPPSAYPADNSDWFIYEYSGGPPTEFFTPGVVRVTAEFGYEKVPAQISWLAGQAVKYWYETQVAHFGRQVDAAQGIVTYPEQLPSAVLKGLRPWVSPGKYVLS